MQTTRIPSPARSQDGITPRRSKARTTRSVSSPAVSGTSGRLTSIIDEFKEAHRISFAPSPLNKSVLTDNTEIEHPRRQSWWRKVNQSRNISEVIGIETAMEPNVIDDLEIEVLSQNKNNYSLDLPESSGSESIASIIVPQRKLFTQKENVPHDIFKQILGSRQSMTQQNKTNVEDKTVNIGTKTLFGQGVKRSRPAFPAALLSRTPVKTQADKTRELATEVKAQRHNLFGHRPQTERKNIFADFIVSESEDEISDIQPKLFAFQRNTNPVRHSTASRASRGYRETSPASSITTDIEMEDWKMLPSSTMMEHQFEAIAASTPGKKARLSKLSEAKESDAGTSSNNTTDKTKLSNKSSKSKTTPDLSNKEPVSEQSTALNSKESMVNENKDEVEIISTKQNLELNKSKEIKNTSLRTFIEREDNIDPNGAAKVNNQTQVLNKSGHSNLPVINEKSLEVTKIQNEPTTADIVQENENDDDENITLTYDDNDQSDHGESHAPINRANKLVQIEELFKKCDDKLAVNVSVNTDNNTNTNQSKLKIISFVEEMELTNEKCLNQNDGKEHYDSQHMQDENLDITLVQNYDEKKNAAQQQDIDTADKEISITGEEMEVDQEIKGLVETAQSEINAEQQDKDQNADEDDQEKEVVSEGGDKNKQDNHKATNNRGGEEVQVEDDVEREEEQLEEYVKKVQIEDVEEEVQFEVVQHDDEGVQVEDNEEAQVEYDKDQIKTQMPLESEEEQQQNESEVEIEDQNESEVENEEDQNQDEENEDVNMDVEKENVIEGDEESFGGEYEEEEQQNLGGEDDENQNETEMAESEEEERHEQRDDDDGVQLEDDEEEIPLKDDEEAEVEDDEDQNKTKMALESEEEQQENESEVENEDQNESEVENEEDQNESEVENEENQNEDEEENEDADMDIEQENEIEDLIEENEENLGGEVQESEHEEIGDTETSEAEVINSDVTHSTTGKSRQKDVKSPEAILRNISNQNVSFSHKGRNTSIRKTVLKNLTIRRSEAPPRESTGLDDGTKNSSAEGSCWDSHRTTRKTLRQTFGKDFTPRKSLRTLVMEKSAKRQTAINEANAKLHRANSTEIAGHNAPDIDVEFDNVETIDVSNHEISKKTRQTQLEAYLQNVKKAHMESKLKIEAEVRNLLTRNPVKVDSLIRVPYKSIRKTTIKSTAPKAIKRTKPNVVPLEDMPEEFIEDMKYRPPKRYQPRNAPWITKRLYKFLETKLEAKYDYKARLRAEKLVETLYEFTRRAQKQRVASPNAIAELEHEMARLDIVKTHLDFYDFFHDYMPREVIIKVVPDIVNDIPLPRNGPFSNIIE